MSQPPPLPVTRFWRLVTVLCGCWLATLWGLTLAGRADHTPSGLLILALLVLPWLHLATTLSLLVLLLGRARRRVGVLLVVHLLLGLSRAESFAVGLRMPIRSQPAELNMLTWNLAGLGRWGGGDSPRCSTEDVTPEVIATLSAQQPDALVLLEISQTRLSALTEALSLTCEQIDYLGTGGEAHGGLAVCVPDSSDWSITASRDLELPPEWAYVFAELTREDQRLNILAVHLVPLGVTTDDLAAAVEALHAGDRAPARTFLSTAAAAAARQAQQAQALQAVLQQLSDPTIIAGDFNSTPDSAIHHDLRRTLTDAWDHAGWGLGSTRTVGVLPMRIDYIYTTDPLRVRGIDTFDCRCAGDRLCSDHRGLTATIVP